MSALHNSTFIVAAFALALGGCSADFDPSSELKTLRIIGVQKDKPYAKPGEEVETRMLWYDGSKNIGRPVQVAWFSGCFDPPGDLYQGCFEAFAAAGSGQSGPGLPPGIALGDRFKFTMPDDIISRRPPPIDPKQPAYGLAYLFFAVCAGQLGPAPEGTDGSFPIACYGPDDEPLGPDDFVAGYSSIYAFDNYRNENPIVTGFQFRGEDNPSACIGDACIGAPQPDADCNVIPCVEACPDNGGGDCPEYSIKPIIDPASAELDQVSIDSYDEFFEEQMWVRYYVMRGGVKSDVRLLNDAKKGWNDDYGTKFRAPKQTGVVSIWAVIHDNRGGVQWARQDVLVQ